MMIRKSETLDVSFYKMLEQTIVDKEDGQIIITVVNESRRDRQKGSILLRPF